MSASHRHEPQTLLIESVRPFLEGEGLAPLQDVLIHEGKVFRLDEPEGQEQFTQNSHHLQRVEGQGGWLLPAATDLHTTLRDPGWEYKETLEQLCASASAGGFVRLVTSPATHPIHDHRAVGERLRERARAAGGPTLLPLAAISHRLEHQQLSEMAELVEAGVGGFSDGEIPIERSDFLRRAMEYLTPFQRVRRDDLWQRRPRPLFLRCEDPHLAGNGTMHEGFTSTRMGLKGIPAEAESLAVYRALALSRRTGCPIHLTRLSCAQSVALVRQFKAEGTPVTCDVAVHQLFFTDERVRGYDPHARVSPPFRSESDRCALIHGINDGTINAIASGHAPQSLLEKEVEFEAAGFGTSSLETTLPAVLTLVNQGQLDLQRAVDALCIQPARIVGERATGLKTGVPADCVLVDPDAHVVVNPSQFLTPARSSLFEGQTLTGRVLRTMAGGRTIWSAPGRP